MDKAEEMKRALEEDPDFVALPRYGCSLKRVLDRYPEGLPTTIMAAKALGVSEDEYDSMVTSAVEKLKAFF